MERESGEAEAEREGQSEWWKRSFVGRDTSLYGQNMNEVQTLVVSCKMFSFPAAPFCVCVRERAREGAREGDGE